jgi:branched-chain amino acid transport system ATP-binding protein
MTPADMLTGATRSDDTLLTTQQLRKSFGETRAVDGVDFRVREGEVLALVGSNGAGKTSLVNLISGLLRPDAGTITFQGRDITHLSVYDRIKAGIARSFQLVNLFDQLTAFENVRLSILSREGKIRRLLRLVDRDPGVRREALEVLDRFGLEDKANMLAGGLAQGERKLLDVAVAYALQPKFLLLDEPTSGVSTREKSTIMDTVAEVVKSGGITAVIIEHDMDVVFTYAARVVMMHQGRILADGTPEEIRRNDKVANTLLGGSFSAWDSQDRGLFGSD